MNALLKLAHAIDRISEWFGKIATFLVLVVVAIGFYNVAARYIGRFIGVQLSSNRFIELQWYTYSLIFFLGFPYVLKHGDNVRVDILYANWPAKRKAWIDLLGTVFFLIPFCLIGIHVAINPVLLSWGRLPGGGWGPWEASPDPGGLPRAPIKTMIIVAFVVLLLQAIAQAIKYLEVITGHQEVVAEIAEETADHVAAE